MSLRRDFFTFSPTSFSILFSISAVALSVYLVVVLPTSAFADSASPTPASYLSPDLSPDLSIVTAEGQSAATQKNTPWGFWAGLDYSTSSTNVSDIDVFSPDFGDPINRFGKTSQTSHRLQLPATITYGKTLTLFTTVQLLAGYLATTPPHDWFTNSGGLPRGNDGAAWGNDVILTQQKLRQLQLHWRTSYGVWQIGRDGSHWGEGILANSTNTTTIATHLDTDGISNTEWGTTKFGHDRGFGDIVDRVLLATAPALLGGANMGKWAQRLQLAIAIDRVVRDERTSWANGDRGYQYLMVLNYKHDNVNSLGSYIAKRVLTDHNGDTLDAWAFDISGKGEWHTGNFKFNTAGELVQLMGTTTLGRHAGCANGKDLLVQQLGGVLRAGASYSPWSIGLEIEGGYASGDSNPNDCKLRGFRFDPNFNPSLILFEQVQAAETIASAANAGNLSRVGFQAVGVEQIASLGSVNNTRYLKPTLRYVWNNTASVRLAWLYAQSEEAIVDPYSSSALAGGGSSNFHGRICTTDTPCSKELGHELNVGIDFRFKIASNISATPSHQASSDHHTDGWLIDMGIEAGRFWPGEALANTNGSRPPKVTALFAQMRLYRSPSK